MAITVTFSPADGVNPGQPFTVTATTDDDRRGRLTVVVTNPANGETGTGSIPFGQFGHLQAVAVPATVLTETSDDGHVAVFSGTAPATP